jgi:methylsterol monooxygenase
MTQMLKKNPSIYASSSSPIIDMIKFEYAKYKSKGLSGVFFALIYGLSVFYIILNSLVYIWPTQINKDYEGLFHIVILTLVVNTSLIGFNIEFLIYYKLKLPFFEKYKTSANPWPWEEDQVKWRQDLKKTLKLVGFNSLIIFPILLSPSLITNDCPFRLDHESMPTAYEAFTQIMICLLIEDIIFYIAHRILHWGVIYQQIHKVHHEHIEGVSITALYSHPIEYIFAGILPPIFGPLLLGKQTHFITILALSIMGVHASCDRHSGYNFPWSYHGLMPFRCDADFHGYHHLKFKGNYSNYFTFWDFLFGTVNKKFLDYLFKAN